MSTDMVRRRPSILDVFARIEADENRKDPGRPARLAEVRHQKAMVDEAEREAIIARYGSEEEAIAGSEVDQLLAVAVAKLRRVVPVKYDNGTFPREAIDGYHGGYDQAVPDRVRQFVENAVPLPVTIADAHAEYMHWRTRDRELELIYRNNQADTQLPLECMIRLKIVQDLLETGLRATSLEDAIVRQRYAVEMGKEGCAGQSDEAVLLDLEQLARQGVT